MDPPEITLITLICAGDAGGLGVVGFRSKDIFPFVAQKILKMSFIQHERDLSPERNALFCLVTMIVVELAPLSLIFLRIWTITLSWPTNGRSDLCQRINNTSDVDIESVGSDIRVGRMFRLDLSFCIVSHIVNVMYLVRTILRMIPPVVLFGNECLAIVRAL